MKKNIWNIFFFLSIALEHGVMHAQIFSCKDASGRTLTSDRPIPECADRSVRELNNNGVMRREIPPPLTAEQKQKKKLQDDKLQAEAVAAEGRKKSDHALLERYRNEKDIELARVRAIRLLEDYIKRETVLLTAAEKLLKIEKGEDDSYKKTASPASLKKILEAEQVTRDEKKIIEEYEQKIVQVNEQYDLLIKRFREITGGLPH